MIWCNIKEKCIFLRANKLSNHKIKFIYNNNKTPTCINDTYDILQNYRLRNEESPSGEWLRQTKINGWLFYYFVLSLDFAIDPWKLDKLFFPRSGTLTNAWTVDNNNKHLNSWHICNRTERSFQTNGPNHA